MKHPNPGLSAEMAPFWEAEGDSLMLPWCPACSVFQWPRRARCACGGPTAWKPCGGDGSVVSWSVVRRAANPEMKSAVPYVVAFVELDAGVRLFTNLVNVAPEAVRAGMRVRCGKDLLAVESRELRVPVFTPGREPAVMDHCIPDDLRQYAELTRKFVLNELRPHEEEVEHSDHLPDELRHRLRGLAVKVGLFGFNMPEAAGGPGLSYLAQVLIREQLGHVSVALADLVGRPPAALLACTDDQRQRFLIPSMRAEKTWAFALTEPDAGSDAMAMKTRAVRDDGAGGWRLSGTKHFISHGNFADYLIVIARAGSQEAPSPTAFLVERGMAGFSVGRVHRKMGWRGYPVAELVFDGVFVPDANVLGRVGDGLRIGLRNISEARVGVAAHCLGMAQRAFDHAVAYLKVRQQFGRPIGSYQGLQWKVADMALAIEQSRCLVYAAARAMDAAAGGKQGGDVRTAVAMAKLSASEMAGQVADQALQLMGGAGYMAEAPLEMIYRDARAFRIGEGTSEIQKIQIAKAALGPEMFA